MTSSPPASSASLAPLANGRMASSSPWTTRTGHRTRVASSAARSGSENGSPWALDPEPGRDQRLRVGLQPPAHGVLDRLGGVRLGEHLREEELQELPVVLAPVVLVVLGPPVGRVQPLGERVREPGGALAQRQRRGDEDDPRHPLGMERAELQRPGGAQRHRDQHRPLGAGGIHDGQGVGGELGRAVCLGLGRPVGAAVAAPVEGEHPAMPREVGDLHLPVPRVHDRPGRQQQHRRLARAVDLVVDLDPVALDVAVMGRLACPHPPSSPVRLILPRAVGSARRRVAAPSGSAAPPGRSRAAAAPPSRRRRRRPGCPVPRR